jgi:hypothetical protein
MANPSEEIGGIGYSAIRLCWRMHFGSVDRWAAEV